MVDLIKKNVNTLSGGCRSAASPAALARSAAGGGEAALGILTKFVDRVDHETVDAQTGEVFKYQRVTTRNGHQEDRQKYDFTAQRLEKWLMRKRARSLLMIIENRQKRIKVPYTKIAPLPHPDPKVRQMVAIGQAYKYEDMPGEEKKSPIFRVINCGRDKIGSKTDVEIWKSNKDGECNFHKVQVCGSVWTCPVCSAKINRVRQDQIQRCYNAFEQQEQSDCMMITFTIRHGISDQLSDTLSMMKEAFRLLQRTSIYKEIAGHTITRQKDGQKILKRVPSLYDFVGRISATEMTHGRSGWHPHMHQLWFFDRTLTSTEIESLRAGLFSAWEACCTAVGLPAPMEFYKGKALGVDIRRALSAAQYLAKFGSERQWGPERELASAHSKKAKLSGRTPFQILFDSMQGDEKSDELFVDYAYATLGKHQLEFSKNLRIRLNELGVNDLDQTDEEISATLEEESVQQGTLSDAEFRALASLPDTYMVEPFSTVLMICKMSGFEACRSFIHSLPSYSPPIVSSMPYENLHLRNLKKKYG